MFVLPDADIADDADERRSFIVLKENKSAFFCVVCARLRPVNTSKRLLQIESDIATEIFLVEVDDFGTGEGFCKGFLLVGTV